MSEYVVRVAKVGCLRILACSPTYHSRKATASVAMKGYMQPLSSIPVDVIPRHRRLPLTGFLSVKEFDCATLKEAIVAKEAALWQ